MQDNRVSSIPLPCRHHKFYGFTMKSLGRDTLEDVYASVFRREHAWCAPADQRNPRPAHVAFPATSRPGDELLRWENPGTLERS